MALAQIRRMDKAARARAELRSAWAGEGARPTRALRLRLFVLVEGIQETVDVLL
jgi:hypothetical protein